MKTGLFWFGKITYIMNFDWLKNRKKLNFAEFKFANRTKISSPKEIVQRKVDVNKTWHKIFSVRNFTYVYVRSYILPKRFTKILSALIFFNHSLGDSIV